MEQTIQPKLVPRKRKAINKVFYFESMQEVIQIQLTIYLHLSPLKFD